MNKFDLSYGVPLTHQKIVPGNTVTAIGTNVKSYILKALRYTSGGTYVMKAGDTIVGATSGATGVIVSRTIDAGTDAGGDAAGILILKCQVGTFQSENLNVEGNSNVATIAANSVAYLGGTAHEGSAAKAMLVTVESNDVQVTFDGTYPSQTPGFYGHKLLAGDSLLVFGENAVSGFRCVDRVSGSASTVKVTCLF
jgi:hypothetical protein